MAGRDRVPGEAEKDSKTFFNDLGFGLRVEPHDLHAEYMPRGEPGRASFFVEGRNYQCVDLLRGDGTVLALHYGVGETVEEALTQARKRFLSEQR